jgi:hypothetical protein
VEKFHTIEVDTLGHGSYNFSRNVCWDAFRKQGEYEWKLMLIPIAILLIS